jgi:neutral amino acid transport system ATP-binding protein
MSDATSCLQVEGVVAGYVPEVDILRGVSIKVATGEIVTVVGPNGAGKSTLIKAVIGLVPVRSGAIRLRGADVAGLPTHAVVRAGVGYVAQRENVFANLTIAENLEVAFRGAGAWQARAEELYAIFPALARRRRQLAGTMSGGERQMVAVARALMASPPLLLLDEPSAGLSPLATEDLFEKIEQINRSGVTVLMVEQNARVALPRSTRGYVLDLGRERFEGRGAELLDDPQVAELYLGRRRAAAAGG